MGNTDKLYGRIKKHIPRSKDPVLVILKAHLLIEERLHGLIQNHLLHPEKLGDARLTFLQSLRLCQAMTHDPKLFLWRFVERLNQVRNKLTHHLDIPDIEAMLDSLLKAWDDSEAVKPIGQGERIRGLKNVIVMACGFLEGFRMEQKAVMDDLRQRRRRRSAGETP